MKAYFEAYGCALNVGETREVERRLNSMGWESVGSPGSADLVVLGTCVVVAKTERNMLKRVAALSSAPRLIVTGCMASVCRESAEALAPRAEFWPPGSLDALCGSFSELGPPHRTPEGDAYVTVPIATGCRGSCSYCVTRLARGGLRSRPAARVLGDVASAVRDGPKEVQLAAQDTASYGLDIGADLPELVSRVCSIPGEFRVRVGMMNPGSAVQALDRVAGMYLDPKMFKFLHLPVQSGSDRVLDAMARGYSVADFLRVVGAVRSVAPGLSLSTDLIVGYPGETAEDHKANIEVMERCRPDIVNVTKFSPRPGTPASGAPGRIHGSVVRERSREISRVRFRIALEVNSSWVGREVRALATEGGKRGTTILRTDDYRQVVVPGRLDMGAFHSIRVDDATPTYLIGSRGG
jgi:MiaB/RimO family radical SAM methylthiotransferase